VKLDVCFTPAELVGLPLNDRIAVVVDVLRATSTVVEALANEARAVCPVRTPEEASLLAQRIGREDTLLCGERKGVRIDGFDLGNSPAEYTAERVAGKFLALTTTNGTGALLAAAGARRILVASFLNLTAVARLLAQEAASVLVLCAGREGRFALDDGACAGALILALRDQVGRLTMNDAAAAAAALARPHRKAPLPVLKASAAGRALAAQGFMGDLAFCAALDTRDLVPELRDQRITVAA
jgi:2-phosphosulfolactate phosphatase